MCPLRLAEAGIEPATSANEADEIPLLYSAIKAALHSPQAKGSNRSAIPVESGCCLKEADTGDQPAG